MSARLDVPMALKALIAAATAPAVVKGLVGDEAAPTRPDIAGTIIVRTGDPGEPEIDLSPIAYNWTHRIPVEVIAGSEAQLDAILMTIGAAIEADRTLGGLCDWLDIFAPATEDITNDGVSPPRGAELIATAIYATTTPLN